MKELRSIVGLGTIVLLFGTGLYDPILKFFGWVIMLSYAQSSISLMGFIVVRCLTIVISYAVVGAIFRSIDWFDSGIMKTVYFVLSTLISCVLGELVLAFETYWLPISIILVVFAVILGTYWSIRWYRENNIIKEDSHGGGRI